MKKNFKKKTKKEKRKIFLKLYLVQRKKKFRILQKLMTKSLFSLQKKKEEKIS